VNAADIQIDHFFNEPGKPGVCRVVHLPTGKQVTGSVGKEPLRLLLQRLINELSDIVPPGNIALDPSWLTSTVTNLAEAIYQERAFDRLPILADALEEAGCNQQDILGHLRGGGEHCRGCWPVDLLLRRS
jgi:hypothetical protein